MWSRCGVDSQHGILSLQSKVCQFTCSNASDRNTRGLSTGISNLHSSVLLGCNSMKPNTGATKPWPDRSTRSHHFSTAPNSYFLHRRLFVFELTLARSQSVPQRINRHVSLLAVIDAVSLTTSSYMLIRRLEPQLTPRAVSLLLSSLLLNCGFQNIPFNTSS